MNTLSLCMIVRDEAQVMPACLKSVLGLVDEMIVVDTGSQDGTPAIARSMGATVFSFPWNDDFSAARNESLRHATSSWILVLDGDEVLDPSDHPAIRGLIEKGDGDGFRLLQRNYEGASKDPRWTPVAGSGSLSRGCSGYIPSPIVRLFRNLPEVRFKGRVHELVEHDLTAQGRRIIDANIPIHHYGKMLGRERLQRKHDLYRRMGESKLLDLPRDPRAFSELGVQYLELGIHREAESLLRCALELAPGDPSVLVNLAAALEKGGKGTEAEETYRRLLAVDPDHLGGLNNLALLLQRQSAGVLRARPLYEKAISQIPAHPVLRFNYGILLEKAGLREEARQQYEKALEIHSAFEEAKRGLERLTNPVKPKATVSGEAMAGQEAAQAEALLRQEKWIPALEFLVPALEKDPEACDIRFSAPGPWKAWAGGTKPWRSTRRSWPGTRATPRPFTGLRSSV